MQATHKRRIIALLFFEVAQMIKLPSEVQERIFSAADELFEESDREKAPTVDQVRRLARVDMNAASAGMREWRRLRMNQGAQNAVVVPESIMQVAQQMVGALWSQSQALANQAFRDQQAAWESERAELELVHNELSAAYEVQESQIDEFRQAAEKATKDAQDVIKKAENEVASLRQALNEALIRAERAEATAAALQVEVGSLKIEVEKGFLAREEAAKLGGMLEALRSKGENPTGSSRKSKNSG